MELEEYKAAIKKFAEENNDFNLDIDELMKKASDADYAEFLSKNCPANEVYLYLMLKGSSIGGKKIE